MVRIGFIGFGEAAYYITCGISEKEVELYAFDAVSDQDSPRGRELRERAQQRNVCLVASMEELVLHSEIVLCLTSANSALPIAKSVSVLLKKGQYYVDMNSTAPDNKRAIADVFCESSDATFVEAAVMASVPANKAKVPVLVCGAGAETVAEKLNGVGMNFKKLSDEIGAASAMKMIKSVLFKGYIALLTETVFAADQYHIVDQVLEAFKSILTREMTFEECTNYFLGTGATHCERLSHEMEEVVETLESMSENAIMSKATLQKMRWLTTEGYGKQFSVRPESYQAILDFKRYLNRKEEEK